MQNSASSLAEKLRARTEKERQATEALFQENFHALQQHLQASSKTRWLQPKTLSSKALHRWSRTSAPAAGLWGRYSAVPVGWPCCGAVQS